MSATHASLDLSRSVKRLSTKSQRPEKPGILMFSRRLYPDRVGGREVFVAELIEALGSRDHHVEVLSESTISWSLPRIENVPLLRLDLPLLGFGLFCISAILSAVRLRRRFHVIHTHSPRLNVALGAFIARLLSKPHVITVHCSTTESALRDIGTGSAYTSASAVVAVSPAMAGAIHAQLGSLSNVVVIPSSSAPSREARSRSDIRKGFGLSDDGVVLVYLGRLSTHKQPELVLAALEDLGIDFLEHRGVVFAIAGDGPDRESLMRKTEECSIRSRVVYLGSLPHEAAMDLLSASDIFVLPSRHEGLGIAVVEAMRASLAVVVTDAEGLRDLVIDGRTGLLFPVGDARSLAETLRRLVIDSELRQSLGQAARAYAQERFDFSSIVSRHENLYQHVVEGSFPVRTPPASALGR